MNPIEQPTSDREVLLRDAYERMAPEREALDANDLVPITIDIPTAVATVLGALPEVLALRPAMVEALPKLDFALFDKLEPCTLALGHAQALYLMASQPVDALQKLAEEGATLRETLSVDVAALARRGLIEEPRALERRGALGYKNLAMDLQMHASLFREHWVAIQGKCGVALTEIERAEYLASHILRTVGLRDQAPALIAASSENRSRAFTLFMRAYDEARHAVVYLRWAQDDADSIAPSLYAGRGGGRRKANPAEPPKLPTPGTTPGGTVSPPVTPPVTLPASPSTTHSVNGTMAAAAPIPVGYPGSDPFLR